MIFGFRKYLIGIIIGLLAGLWMGVNIGREQPLWSNPFEKQSLTDKAREKASSVLDEAKKAISK